MAQIRDAEVKLGSITVVEDAALHGAWPLAPAGGKQEASRPLPELGAPDAARRKFQDRSVSFGDGDILGPRFASSRKSAWELDPTEAVNILSSGSDCPIDRDPLDAEFWAGLGLARSCHGRENGCDV